MSRRRRPVRTWDKVEAREIVALLPGETINAPISGAGFPAVATKALAQRGIFTLVDLGAASDADILAIPGIGPRGLEAVKRALRFLAARTPGSAWSGQPPEGDGRKPDDVANILRGYPDAWLDTTLTDLPFSPGALRAFAWDGLRTLRDLRDDDQLLGLPDMGPTRVRAVKRVLARYPDMRVEAEASAAARRAVAQADGEASAVLRREDLERRVQERTAALAAVYGKDLLSELREGLEGAERQDRAAVEAVSGLGQPQTTLARVAEALCVSKQAVDQRVHAALHRIGAARGWGWRFRDAVMSAMSGCQEPMPLPSVCARHPFLSGLERHPRLFAFLVRIYLRPDTSVVAIPILHLYPFADAIADGDGHDTSGHGNRSGTGKDQES